MVGPGDSEFRWNGVNLQENIGTRRVSVMAKLPASFELERGATILCQAWLECLYMMPAFIVTWTCHGQPMIFPSGEATWMRD